MKKIGFIGTGIMGRSMVRNLMKAGYQVAVYNRTKSKAEELVAEGAVWCDSPAECAQGRDVVITIVGYPKDVEQVYFGEDGVIKGADPGTCLIDMTTTSPKLMRVSARVVPMCRKSAPSFAMENAVLTTLDGLLKKKLSIHPREAAVSHKMKKATARRILAVAIRRLR